MLGMSGSPTEVTQVARKWVDAIDRQHQQGSSSAGHQPPVQQMTHDTFVKCKWQWQPCASPIIMADGSLHTHKFTSPVIISESSVAEQLSFLKRISKHNKTKNDEPKAPCQEWGQGDETPNLKHEDEMNETRLIQQFLM